jgi:DNA-binding NarL/FixJ family response regulator
MDRPTPPVARVLLCDDATAFGMIFRLRMGECDVEVVAQAADDVQAIELAVQHHPDVIVLDHLLRNVTSDDLAPRLREAAPDARLLLISSLMGEDLAAAARQAGADGHISKAASTEQMCAAVLALVPVAGETVRPPGDVAGL